MSVKQIFSSFFFLLNWSFETDRENVETETKLSNSLRSLEFIKVNENDVLFCKLCIYVVCPHTRTTMCRSLFLNINFCWNGAVSSLNLIGLYQLLVCFSFSFYIDDTMTDSMEMSTDGIVLFVHLLVTT